MDNSPCYLLQKVAPKQHEDYHDIKNNNMKMATHTQIWMPKTAETM
jgi:hypothetical protein